MMRKIIFVENVVVKFNAARSINLQNITKINIKDELQD